MRLTSNYHWQVRISNVIVNGVSITLTNTKDAILDTGTSLTYVPVDEYNQIYA